MTNSNIVSVIWSPFLLFITFEFALNKEVQEANAAKVAIYRDLHPKKVECDGCIHSVLAGIWFCQVARRKLVI
jgi:hypothetical protein